ncbi:MAG: hypothetical protein KatS3mg059_0048 [Thermomicrobiales bacterium]|nr:MAG: hypothetical protein KatS3mg059_0048 [Thermomicrobiales bacterium]
MSARELQELLEAWQQGRISRRSFFTSALALGVSAGAASALMSTSHRASAQDQPTPVPTPTPIQETHGSASASVKISYWTILSGPDGDEMNALVGKFTDENPDIAVESLQGLTDFVPKMQAAAISGTAPDVALVRNHYIGPFASKGRPDADQPRKSLPRVGSKPRTLTRPCGPSPPMRASSTLSHSTSIASP